MAVLRRLGIPLPTVRSPLERRRGLRAAEDEVLLRDEADLWAGAGAVITRLPALLVEEMPRTSAETVYFVVRALARRGLPPGVSPARIRELLVGIEASRTLLPVRRWSKLEKARLQVGEHLAGR